MSMGKTQRILHNCYHLRVLLTYGLQISQFIYVGLVTDINTDYSNNYNYNIHIYKNDIILTFRQLFVLNPLHMF